MITRKVVVCGLDNAGKTSIVRLIRTLRPELAAFTSPSVSLEREFKLSQAGKFVFLVVPGQRRFYSNEKLSQILAETDCIVFVVDSADRSRISEARELLRTVLRVYVRVGRGRRLVVFAHKQDLSSAMSGCEVLKTLWHPISSEFPEISTDVYETTIFRPSTILRAVREGVIMPLVAHDPFEYLIEHLQRVTHSDVAAAFDEEAFPLSVAGDEQTAYEMASLVRELVEHASCEDAVEGAILSTKLKLAFVGRAARVGAERMLVITCVRNFGLPLADTIKFLRRTTERMLEELRTRYTSTHPVRVVGSGLA